MAEYNAAAEPVVTPDRMVNAGNAERARPRGVAGEIAGQTYDRDSTMPISRVDGNEPGLELVLRHLAVQIADNAVGVRCKENYSLTNEH
jgi:hypothetical protein